VANHFVWVLLLALAPFAVLLCCFRDGETQIWLGDVRVAALVVFFANLHVTTCVSC